jgi:hypothetical protein
MTTVEKGEKGEKYKMATKPVPSLAANIKPGTTNLDVPAGHTVVLSPTAPQFTANYHQIHPQTMDQVRELFWFVRPDPKTVKTRMAAAVAAIAKKPFDIKNLESTDVKISRTARLQAYQVATEYVRNADISSLVSWKPVLDRYLVLNKAVLNIISLMDITVNNGATLQVSTNTHAIYARNFIIHGTGKVVCHAKCSFRLTTLQGIK